MIKQTETDKEKMWKHSWECVKKELEKTINDYEKLLEKKNEEIRQLVAIIERGGK
jgi:hypothetical protein